MIIVNGMCYADNFEKVLKIISVTALYDYKLKVTFSTGETKVCNFKPMLKYPAFKHLKDAELFNKCYIDKDFGVVCWDDNTDIASEYLYENGYLV